MDDHHLDYITKLTQKKKLFIYLLLLWLLKRLERPYGLTWKHKSKNAQNQKNRNRNKNQEQTKDHLLVDSSAELVQEFFVISFRDFEELVDEVLAFQ